MRKTFGFYILQNFTGSYSRTFPSVAYLLSGVKYDYDIPSAEYMKKAMSESNFFGALQAAGYESRLYTDTQYVTGSVESFNGTVKNAKSTEGKAKPMKILSAMLNLSAYRYSPEAMKPYFHIYTDNIAQNTFLAIKTEAFTPLMMPNSMPHSAKRNHNRRQCRKLCILSPSGRARSFHNE